MSVSLKSTTADPVGADPVARLFHYKPSVPTFEDRSEAGMRLGQELIRRYGDDLQDAVILGLVRGGLVVAEAVSKELQKYHPTLDCIVCCKIAHPNNKELGLGSITQSGEVQLQQDLRTKFHIDEKDLQDEIAMKKEELERRLKLYREGRPPLDLEGKTCIIVDDGLARGSTAQAAIESVKALANHKEKKILLAIPVASERNAERVANAGNLDPHHVCCIEFPKPNMPIGTYYWDIDDYYREFEAVSDEKVCKIMKESSGPDRRVGDKSLSPT